MRISQWAGERISECMFFSLCVCGILQCVELENHLLNAVHVEYLWLFLNARAENKRTKMYPKYHSIVSFGCIGYEHVVSIMTTHQTVWISNALICLNTHKPDRLLRFGYIYMGQTLCVCEWVCVYKNIYQTERKIRKLCDTASNEATKIISLAFNVYIVLQRKIPRFDSLNGFSRRENVYMRAHFHANVPGRSSSNVGPFCQSYQYWELIIDWNMYLGEAEEKEHTHKKKTKHRQNALCQWLSIKYSHQQMLSLLTESFIFSASSGIFLITWQASNFLQNTSF